MSAILIMLETMIAITQARLRAMGIISIEERIATGKLRSGTELGLYSDPPLYQLEEVVLNQDKKIYERDYTL